jgi:hypothetical protein
VALRGAGADSTKLTINGSCTGGGIGFNRAINLISGAAGVGCAGNCGGTPPSQTATWSAGYAQGTTVITLSSVTGLTAGTPGTGSIIMLDQMDDNNSGFPTINDVIQCATAAAWCSNKGGNQWARPGRAQVQVVTVTAINGNQVTISPPIAYPNYRSSQSPGAWWNNTQLHNASIEDLSVDYTNAGTIDIFVKDASNVWIKGVRSINTDTSTAESYHFWLQNSAHVAIRSNYIYGKNTTCNPFPLANYAITSQQVSDVVIENNIMHHTNNAYIPNDPGGRNVYAYNWHFNNVIGVAGAQPHSGHMLMDLYEGNDWETYMGDVTHGTHNFVTLYRNLFDGTANNNSCTTGYAIGFLTNNRFNNAIGNVIGSSSYSQYEANDENGGGGTSASFNLGWNGNNSGTPVNPDSNVKRTLMRWGNWDQFTSTNDTGANDQTGIRWDGTEVPSGISNFPNAVPGDHNLPSSFYLTSKPAWFGSTPFPAIGPDVASGNAPNSASTPTGGHANRIPARTCYESLTNDTAYGSMNIKVFNADSCYGSGGNAPAPPQGLVAVPK